MPEIYFDERIAASYDATSTEMFDPVVVVPAIDFLAELAGDGAALELGIGTGRIALPPASAASPSTGSSSLLPWSNDCGRRRARTASV